MNISKTVKDLVFYDTTPTEAQKRLLETVINLTQSKLLARLPGDGKAVPGGLEHIVIEVAIERFNRIGSEGMSQESQDGHSVVFTDDPFKAYEAEIQAYIDGLEDVSGKVVRFL